MKNSPTHNCYPSRILGTSGSQYSTVILILRTLILQAGAPVTNYVYQRYPDTIYATHRGAEGRVFGLSLEQMRKLNTLIRLAGAPHPMSSYTWADSSESSDNFESPGPKENLP